MKKFFALLLALAMILALSACGEKQQEPSNEGDEQDNTPAQTFNFKVSITQASTDPLATYTQQRMDEVTEKTNGAVTFEFHPNGELGTINDVRADLPRCVDHCLCWPRRFHGDGSGPGYSQQSVLPDGCFSDRPYQ